jgi:hypothetical protein
MLLVRPCAVILPRKWQVAPDVDYRSEGLTELLNMREFQENARIVVKCIPVFM